jgi:hypothetical protein
MLKKRPLLLKTHRSVIIDVKDGSSSAQFVELDPFPHPDPAIPVLASTSVVPQFEPPSTKLPPMVLAWARQHTVTKKRKTASIPPQLVGTSPVAKRTRLSLLKSRVSSEDSQSSSPDKTLDGLLQVRQRRMQRNSVD